MYNMVGFQTKLTYPEQERVFRLIPALARRAVFQARQHPQKYLHQRPVAFRGLSSNGDERIFFAGQITGVEGYMESTAMGLLAGIAALCRERGREFEPPEPTTCIGRALPVPRDGEEGFPAHERELRPPRGVSQDEEGNGGANGAGLDRPVEGKGGGRAEVRFWRRQRPVLTRSARAS